MEPKDNILSIKKWKLAECLRVSGLIDSDQEITHITEDPSRECYIMKVEFKPKWI